jgi:hypothetical protein
MTVDELTVDEMTIDELTVDEMTWYRCICANPNRSLFSPVMCQFFKTNTIAC